jgi:hypothetical protein
MKAGGILAATFVIMKKGAWWKPIILAVVIAAPLLVSKWLSIVDQRFDAVVNAYECDREVCAIDFNGDGIEGVVQLVGENSSNSRSLVVIDGGQELLRLPYTYIDGTLRTHVALCEEVNGSRLIIFDGTRGKHEIVKAVYAWDGTRVIEVPPSDLDRQVLQAMEARDHAGTWTYWGFYRTFSTPALLVYYALLLMGLTIGWIVKYRLRRVRKILS